MYLLESKLSLSAEPQWAEAALIGLTSAGTDMDAQEDSNELKLELVEQLLLHLSRPTKLRQQDAERGLLRSNILAVLLIAVQHIERADHSRLLLSSSSALSFVRRLVPLGGEACWAVFALTRNALLVAAQAARRRVGMNVAPEYDKNLTQLVLLVQNFMVIEL